jgi:group I intron endonuclease
MPFVNKIHRSGCCIYRIENATKKKNYIGQTTNITFRREKHKNNLKKGIHQNKDMQHDFNNGDVFVITALEYFPPQVSQQMLNAKEQAYIDRYNATTTGYNKRNSPLSRIKCKTKTEKYIISSEKIKNQIDKLNQAGGVTFAHIYDIAATLNCRPWDILQTDESK